MWSTGSKERVGQQASWGPGVRKPLAIRSYRPLFDALLLQIMFQSPALDRRLRLPPPPSSWCLQTRGGPWPGGALRPLAPMALCLRCRLG